MNQTVATDEKLQITSKSVGKNKFMKGAKMIRPPMYEPTLVPAGTYVAEIVHDGVEEKQSHYDPDRTYFELKLILQDSRGNHVDYTYCFTKRSPKLKDIYLVVGGRELKSGHVEPPQLKGKKFKVDIIQRQAQNDKSKTVNDIAHVEPARITEPDPRTPEEPPPIDDDFPAEDPVLD